jgi:hypothetical protein
MPSLFGNLLRENMDQQEDHDQDGRDDDEREPRNDVRDCIERLTVEKRGVRPGWQGQDGKCDQRS